MDPKKKYFSAIILGILITATHCGGGGGGGGGLGLLALLGGGGPGAALTYNVGGTVTGLGAGEQVVLKNGSDTLTVTANGSFTFSEKGINGTTYNVQV